MIRHMTLCTIRFIAACILALAAEAVVNAADPWVNANDAAIVTNNDCGFITTTHGSAQIRRSFLADSDPGAPAHIADRVNSGDILYTPDGSRIEMVSGGNIVLVLGSGSRVKLNGLRNFIEASGKPATRLDLEIISGDVRIQVRRNEEKPEYVLAALEGVDVLVSRGDIAVTTSGGWLVSTLSGEVGGRVRRGNVVGAPFTIGTGHTVGGAGDAQLTDAAANALRVRLPFSFELAALALPPMPPMSWELEAP